MICTCSMGCSESPFREPAQGTLPKCNCWCHNKNTGSVPNSNNKPQHEPNPLPSLADSSQPAIGAPTGTEPLASGSAEAGGTPRIEGFVPIAMIVVDRWPIGRTAYDYAKLMENGVEFPPIKIARRRDGQFQIRDGRHRLLAAKLLGHRAIWARYSSRPMQRPVPQLAIDGIYLSEYAAQ